MASLITNTTPIASGQTWTSTVQNLSRATQITGTVFADQAGLFQIQQSGDGVHWDSIKNFNIPANIGIPIEVDLISQFFQVSFDNTSITDQTALRIYIDARDPYGDFLANALAPSAGGSWAVFIQQPGGAYQWVGRFNAEDGLAANGSAAVYLNKSGQYASFPVTDATVSAETLEVTSQHTLASF